MRCTLCGQEMDPDYEAEMGMMLCTDCKWALAAEEAVQEEETRKEQEAAIGREMREQAPLAGEREEGGG